MGILGTNMYAYCNNDPVNFWDPDGFRTQNIGGAARLFGALINNSLADTAYLAIRDIFREAGWNVSNVRIEYEINPETGAMIGTASADVVGRDAVVSFDFIFGAGADVQFQNQQDLGAANDPEQFARDVIRTTLLGLVSPPKAAIYAVYSFVDSYRRRQERNRVFNQFTAGNRHVTTSVDNFLFVATSGIRLRTQDGRFLVMIN